jgi:SAM-dependent methyltransferase
MADNRLSPRDRRRILEQLPRDRLAELTSRLELDVDDRRSTRSHVDAIVRKRSLDFRSLLEHLRRDELAGACDALGLGAGARDKAALIGRLLGDDRVEPRGAAARAEQPAAPAEARSSSTPPPMSVRGTTAEKSMLRRFVLDAAGGFRGRDAASEFTSRLLMCFGWPDGRPAEATMPAEIAVVDDGQRKTRTVPLLWEARRVLVEVVKHDVMLDFAWKDLLKVCLQIVPSPQYVVLTNQRDLHLYDLGRDRAAPRLSIPLDDLPKYSEAFPFLSASWVPGATPKIVDVTKVSREVADLVARLYRSLKEQHPKREKDVVQFTLQCILTMFAEDIGLLPREYFTSLLYEGARAGDTEARLTDLFRLMATKDVPGRVVPYFNGGLFTEPATLPLGKAQLGALTKASEANWTYVDPHIFGSVFQGIMDDAERHKSGAHYTAHDDIMRVVGPTIVDPWRQRIRGAKTLTELLEVRAALLKFRVLDPACGSGNFLYVAFREMYRLDTELIARVFRDFPSTQAEGKAKVTWGAGIQTSSFFGIDINPFAVELAKVTLNIAKKIAFDERRDMAADLVGQLEIEVDPSLPLDNLEKNIVCADALFADWPKVDAIVGNPPFLGEKWLRKELGPKYVAALKSRYPDTSGDFCVYWFRKSHDHVETGSRVGLVATSGVRLGANREHSLDYIVAHDGVITAAVSERDWPGEANVRVSMVNWHKGQCTGPHRLIIDERTFDLDVIPSHLQLHVDLGGTAEIKANATGTCQGVTFGTQAFYVDAATAARLGTDAAAAPYVQVVANGDDVLGGTLQRAPDFVVHLGRFALEAEARATGAAYRHVREHVEPIVRAKAEKSSTEHYRSWYRTWWRPFWHRGEFLDAIRGIGRVIACSRVASRPIFFFLSTDIVPVEQLQLFAYADDYSFGVLQSDLHWSWASAKGGRREERIRYSTEVWRTFPWPQEPSVAEVTAVAAAGREVRALREHLMKANVLAGVSDAACSAVSDPAA